MEKESVGVLEENVSEMTSSSQERQIRPRVKRKHNCDQDDQVIVILSEKKLEYSVLKEHNYSKRNSCKNLTEIKSTENNVNDLPDWLKVDHNDSDYEDYSEVKSLAQTLKMEYEYDLKNEAKSIKRTHIQKIGNNNSEIETKQNNGIYVLNVSKYPRLFIVQPPLDWVQLIYLTIKNSSMEYVSNMDVQRFCKHWFPYYSGTFWKKLINSALNEYSEVYFTCAYSIALSKYLMWTVNERSVNTLEHILMSAVVQNEDKIKSAMRYPNNLSTMLKGYGVFQLGFYRVELNDADNSNVNEDFK